MEPWTGPNDSGMGDIIVSVFIILVVIGIIMFAAKMIFQGDGPREVVLEDEEKEDD